MPISLKAMVSRQEDRVLQRGQRLERFDQLRTRYFWAKYLFAYGAGNVIQAGPYDIYKVIPSGVGQGYPANCPLTLRETNWRNSGRVPDNQNFAIKEIGVSITRPPSVSLNASGTATGDPTNGIYANLTAGVQALVAPQAPIHPVDTMSMLFGATLEMQYLTNSIPLGYLGDFSQAGGTQSFEYSDGGSTVVPPAGDLKNGIPAAAFRRKFEIPILLEHGEVMGMRINIPKNIDTCDLGEGGAGWLEVHVDWWAYESFVEKS